MRAGEKLGLEQIRAFLEASEEVRFEGRDREEVYGWVNETLRGQGYQDLKRSGPGAGTALHREDDGAEPGADHAFDHAVPGR